MAELQRDEKLQVLLVEDDEDMITLLRFYLERDGYRVTWVPDGRLAQELIEKMPPPHLALLDVMLPYCGGGEILRLIRSKPTWREVPIIMLTALSAEQSIVSLLDAGANDYVVKPFNPKELTARVRRLLRPAV
ncbi:MAG TPA: response regulator transcription factor [Nitrospira sp.]|nr:response regulator transcription factor [Nitrospira sp.]